MTYLRTGFFCVLAYIFTSALLYGGPFQALGLLTFWRDRLGVAYWPVLILVAMVFAIFATKSAVRSGMPHFLAPAVFISISMICSALLVGGYAENQRGRVVESFEPDVELRSSVFSSFRNAPREFQLFLHGAALKNCKPYAWSYRLMEFYELPPDVAANVLPSSWIEECKIRRTR